MTPEKECLECNFASLTIPDTRLDFSMFPVEIQLKIFKLLDYDSIMTFIISGAKFSPGTIKHYYACNRDMVHNDLLAESTNIDDADPIPMKAMLSLVFIRDAQMCNIGLMSVVTKQCFTIMKLNGDNDFTQYYEQNWDYSSGFTSHIPFTKWNPLLMFVLDVLGHQSILELNNYSFLDLRDVTIRSRIITLSNIPKIQFVACTLLKPTYFQGHGVNSLSMDHCAQEFYDFIDFSQLESRKMTISDKVDLLKGKQFKTRCLIVDENGHVRRMMDCHFMNLVILWYVTPSKGLTSLTNIRLPQLEEFGLNILGQIPRFRNFKAPKLTRMRIETSANTPREVCMGNQNDYLFMKTVELMSISNVMEPLIQAPLTALVEVEVVVGTNFPQGTIITLPKLKRLRLQAQDDMTMLPMFAADALTQFELEHKEGRPLNDEEMINLVISFPRLKYLTIKEFNIRQYIDVREILRKVRHRLVSLSLMNIHIGFYEMKYPIRFERLETLNIQNIAEIPRRVLPLQIEAPNLKEMELHLHLHEVTVPQYPRLMMSLIRCKKMYGVLPRIGSHILYKCPFCWLS
ncbi:uncharacterized protein CYBJADRAFT_174415 [Cyberlindnera jadinii NRRL Y-1542]|uniref:Uncharacterized protein n=1 Tax=Cyberlindnera jadinii (strain ATCC 18201 / CBS 1600 / BCRC 20928 / JCM 3617 / NBRC 0987 / NRRL Y-1542) TaxID=983966 RepID=A0A1E4RXZ5_CYBJN|nr:hypothetical protein CYBJADRAFT_174415 [Cyberlindnera jadinii NRRL Y-1542]ODV72153.1 hypothetical protein CYBJADRAFT_174415 [Cyberlindnera jadinii NRRL Y-1542]